ncbi:hypothetical protein AWR36_012535 [Microbulbifer flavimaris]|uniref:Uncharacterized protein n=2 Tax=Microbulbiferaceae TaxID=1706373 RepID=A0ABX4HXL5_9GAMM|nr:hypothetical protein AVO43_12500 [Microbulbifer sp. ZGT114]PCO04816.1 hypothetical protein AWR36_012535 [Microbulbifer flavimaris]
MTLATIACLGAMPGASAKETLEVLITTPDGQRHQSLQELGKAFDVYDSGAIAGPSSVREYSAIRCDSAWGAIKYRVPLASGPGYRLQAEGEQLRLQLLQHSVVSEDVNIAAMEVHCFDLGPKAVTHALGEVTLKRDNAQSQRLQLASGYMLEFRYHPDGSDMMTGEGIGVSAEAAAEGTEGTEGAVSGEASRQADSGTATREEG